MAAGTLDLKASCRMDLVLQAPVIGAAELTQIDALCGSQSVYAIEGGCSQAYRLARIESRGGVAEFCAAARIARTSACAVGSAVPMG